MLTVINTSVEPVVGLGGLSLGQAHIKMSSFPLSLLRFKVKYRTFLYHVSLPDLLKFPSVL